MSDRDKGLLNAVQSRLPGAYHAMCCQHIAENIHKKFGRQYKAIFWQIARTADQSTFDSLIQSLQRDSPQVEEYLSSIGYNNFTFLHFPAPRFGHDTSNIVESTNSMWREIRELPPLQLLNGITINITIIITNYIIGIYQWNITTFYKRQHVQLVSGNTILSNSAYQSYKHRELSARGFYILPSSDIEFLVTTSRAAEFIIKLPPLETPLAIGFCSCLKYQEYQAPCSHAIACIQYLSLNPFDYFYPYYRWDVSLRTYSLPITPVSIQGLSIVEDNNSLPLLPPIKKPKRGRPKISRIRSTYLEKKTYLCSICQQPGHNRRICPNHTIEHGRAQRARDQLVEDSISFSDWSGCSDTTSDIIEVDQRDQFDLFWTE